MPGRRSTSIAVIAAALVLGGCSGGDDAGTTGASAGSDDSPPSTAAPTTIAMSTTTASPTTASPTTTTVTSSTPTSAPLPSTSVESVPLTLDTTPPTGSFPTDEQSVVDAILASFAAYNAARLDPTDDQIVEAAADTMSDSALTRYREIIEEYRAEGRREVTFDPAPARVTVSDGAVEVNPDSGSATVDACWLNSNVLVETAGNPDGSDRVVDDTITAFHDRYTLQLDASGRWIVSAIVTEETYPGALECDA